MRYALTAAMAKETDRVTIEEIGVPSVVLMERAAEAVALKTAEIAALFNRGVRVLAVCGCGNNGADAIAAARILSWQGMSVDIAVVGNEEHSTEEYLLQKSIALKSGMTVVNITELPEYDIVIDGILGIGLKGAVREEYEEIIRLINNTRNIVVSVDVPSGVDATTGAVATEAVKADVTVTFGYIKTGILQYPGKLYAGEITVTDIGFYPEAVKSMNPPMYFTPESIQGIPSRKKDANKGTYGRLLVIAGSEDMSGAAYLSGAAALRSGAGLVEIVTHDRNAELIRKMLPEAIVTGYTEDNATDVIGSKLDKSTCIILGPGLSQSYTAEGIVDFVLNNAGIPLIIDADALNIISKDISVLKRYPSAVIITPHIGEMTRLTGMSAEAIKSDRMKVASEFAQNNNSIVVMKDAVTVVAENNSGNRMYINTSGTPAMAKAGLGDVLTGVIAGMYMLGIEPYSAAAMGTYIHGMAGELAAYEMGEHSVIATDVVDCISKVLNTNKGS